MRKLILPLLLIGLVFGQVAVVSSTFILPRLEVSIHNTDLEAGKKNEIIVELTNSGDLGLTEVEVLLTSSSPSLFFVEGNHKVLNEILEESSLNYTATLYVDQNTQSGAYPIQAQLKYVRSDETISLTVPLSVMVVKIFQPMLIISVGSTSRIIKNGYEGGFGFTLENVADKELQNVDIILTSNSPQVTISGDPNLSFSSIQPGNKTEIHTQIKVMNTAPIGPYSLTALAYYSDLEGNRFRQQISLPFEVVTKAPVLTIRNLDPDKEVIPGNAFEIELMVECYDAFANNAKAQLTLDQKGLVTPRGPTTIPLGDLSPGDKIDIKYALLLNGAATPGEIPLALVVRFVEPTGISNSVTETITLEVAEFVEFRLLKQEVFTVEQGKSMDIESDLLLVGTTNVEFASIKIVEKTPFIIGFDSQEYLGAIDPDSPVPFTVTFSVPSDAEIGTYTMPLKVSYLNHRNMIAEKVVELTVEIVKPITQQAASQDEGIWGWLKTIFGLRF